MGMGLRRLVDCPSPGTTDFEIDEMALTNVAVEDLLIQGKQLTIALNHWLTSPTFIPLDQQLRTYLHPNDVIQVVVQTADPWLRRLPWHLWQFFEAYPAAEPALGSLHYRGAIPPTVRSRDLVRILAVLGNSSGIDVTQDQAMLSQLPQAKVVFLVEPTRAELDHWLWQDEGWDILFFAGHSITTPGQSHLIFILNLTGKLNINGLKSF